MMSTRRIGGETKLRFRLKTNGVTLKHICGNIVEGSWQHVAAVYDSSSVTLYVDGVSCNPSTGGIQTGQIATANVPVWIGNNPPGNVDKTFDGLIDEVRIYERGLSA